MIDLDKSNIISLLDFFKAKDHIRNGYIASANAQVQTPDIVQLKFPASNGECHIKSGYTLGTESYVIKIASGFYDNASHGLPSSNGMMLAFSAKTGEPLAILRDEGWLTDMRTGIGGALASLALAKQQATRVLIIGTGIQARLQATCLAKIAPNRTFDFYIWGRNATRCQLVVNDLVADGLTAQMAINLDATIPHSEIIITTTPSRAPLFSEALVCEGTHITAIGADTIGKQELPIALIAKANLRVCDMTKQSLAHGEFQHVTKEYPDLKFVELGNILSGAHPGRTSSSDITIADLTGIAAQDIAITQAILDAAAS